MKRIVIFIAVVVVFNMGRTYIANLSKAHRDDSGKVTSAGSANVTELTVGDCISKHEAIPNAGPSSSGSFKDSDVSLVPCTDKHEWEVYSKQAADITSFNHQKLVTEAQKVCGSTFETFVGVPYNDSRLSVYFYTPTSDSWDNGDRNITCLTGKGNHGTVSGTLQNYSQ